MFSCLHLCAVRFHVYLFYQKHLTKRALPKFHDWYEVDWPDLLILFPWSTSSSPFKLVVVLPNLDKLLFPFFAANFFLFFLLNILKVSATSSLLFLEFHPLNDSFNSAILLTQVLIHVLVRIHESLDCVDTVIVPKDSIDSGAAVTR